MHLPVEDHFGLRELVVVGVGVLGIVLTNDGATVVQKNIESVFLFKFDANGPELRGTFVFDICCVEQVEDFFDF